MGLADIDAEGDAGGFSGASSAQPPSAVSNIPAASIPAANLFTFMVFSPFFQSFILLFPQKNKIFQEKYRDTLLLFHQALALFSIRKESIKPSG